MPIRYVNPLPNPIQQGINVDYFDRKALERQQRHDKARAVWAQETKEIAAQDYQDQAAREQFLKEREAMFTDVVDRNAGNLSKGLHDVLGAVEKSSLHQYHNLNKRFMEESVRQAALEEKYGAELIDQSKGLGEGIYKDGQWADPGSIQSGGIQASDYQKIIETQLNDLAARTMAGQTNLQPGSNAYYLMSKVWEKKTLNEEDLRAIANDPSVQAAFLANAPTAGIDTRKLDASGKTYQDMFSTPEGVSEFIYGNIADKYRNDYVESKVFKQDPAKLQEDRLALVQAKHDAAKALVDHKITREEYSRPQNTFFDAESTVYNKDNVSNLYDKRATSNEALKSLEDEGKVISRTFLKKLKENPNMNYYDLSISDADNNIYRIFKENGEVTEEQIKVNGESVSVLEYYLQEKGVEPEDMNIAISDFKAKHQEIVDNTNLQLEIGKEKETQENLITQWEEPHLNSAFKIAKEKYKKLVKESEEGQTLGRTVRDIIAGDALEGYKYMELYGLTEQQMHQYRRMNQGQKEEFADNLIKQSIQKGKLDARRSDKDKELLTQITVADLTEGLDGFNSQVQNNIDNETSKSQIEVGVKDQGYTNITDGSALKKLSDNLTGLYNVGGTNHLKDPNTGEPLTTSKEFLAKFEDIDTKKNDLKVTWVSLPKPDRLNPDKNKVYIKYEYTDKNGNKQDFTQGAIDNSNQGLILQTKYTDAEQALNNYTVGNTVTPEVKNAILSLANDAYGQRIRDKKLTLLQASPDTYVNFTLPPNDQGRSKTLSVYKSRNGNYVGHIVGADRKNDLTGKGFSGAEEIINNVYAQYISRNENLISELRSRTSHKTGTKLRSTTYAE